MKRIMLLAAVSMVAVMGCSKNNNNNTKPNKPTENPRRTTGEVPGQIAWKVTYAEKKAEGENAPAYVHGFSVTEDRKFEIAGPGGESFVGYLSNEQFDGIASHMGKAIEKINALDAAPATTTEDENTINGMVTFSRGTASKEVVRAEGKEFISHLDAEGVALIKALAKLAQEKGATSFPNADCVAKSKEFEALYATVNGCSVDSDCAFFDDNYTLLRDEAGNTIEGEVTLDACRWANPLTIANATTLNANELMSKYTELSQACGNALDRGGGCKTTTFRSTTYEAKCIKNVCSIGGVRAQTEAQPQ